MSKTTQKILSTAENLFYEHGFNVGVDTIRDVANCSKTTMYNQFGSKDKLICEVLKSRDARFRAELAHFMGENLTGWAAIEAIFQWHWSWFKQPDFNGCLFCRASAELDNRSEQIDNIINQHKSWILALIQSNTQDHTKALIIMTMLEGLISFNLIYHSDTKLCDEAMDSALGAIKHLFTD